MHYIDCLSVGSITVDIPLLGSPLHPVMVHGLLMQSRSAEAYQQYTDTLESKEGVARSAIH